MGHGVGRTYVVTGSAAGIGLAVRTRLLDGGHAVIGVDRRDADVVADLATAAGRRHAIEEVTRRTTGQLNSIIASAGVYLPSTDAVQVNYFGTVALLDGLRPLLAGASEPRAVVINSRACVRADWDMAIAELCLLGDEDAAVRRAALGPDGVYAATKRALVRWMRTIAPSPEWAGCGIVLNAVAPGVMETPMSDERVDDLLAREAFPLGGPVLPADVAAVAEWLTSPDNRFVTGQVIFIDGGWEVATRGEAPW